MALSHHNGRSSPRISGPGSGRGCSARGKIRTSIVNASGTITNGYGVYILDVPATNDYGIYQAGVNDTNYFGGDVGIGTASPKSPIFAVPAKCE